MFRKLLRWLVRLVLLALFAAWLAPAWLLPQRNPPHRYTGTLLSERSDRLLGRACFDCHSNRTRWPWYAYAPPTSLLLAYDVAYGRDHHNYDTWTRLGEQERAEHWREALDAIRRGEMPPTRYRWVHGDAAVSPAALRRLEAEVARRHGERYTRPLSEAERERHER